MPGTVMSVSFFSPPHTNSSHLETVCYHPGSIRHLTRENDAKMANQLASTNGANPNAQSLFVCHWGTCRQGGRPHAYWRPLPPGPVQASMQGDHGDDDGYTVESPSFGDYSDSEIDPEPTADMNPYLRPKDIGENQSRDRSPETRL
ncbi:hypothetical protein Hte_005502 [Hypoxylon texense]